LSAELTKNVLLQTVFSGPSKVKYKQFWLVELF